MEGDLEEAQCLDVLDQQNNSSIFCQLLDSYQCFKRDNDDMDETSVMLSNKRRKRYNLDEDRTSVLPIKKKGKENDSRDRLSELPDDIIVYVLSRLTMKEAVRTSILSSRWRHLWTCFTGCLDFDDPLTMVDLQYYLGWASEPLDVERNKFVSWVNYVLRSLQSRTIEELRICFNVDSDYDVGNWIKFAIERSVQKLELNFTSGVWINTGQYTFPSHVDTYSNFRSLTALRLASVDVTGEVVENLLSCCPLLETMRVERTACLKSLKVSGPSLKLKHLGLRYVNRLEDLKIDADNLTSFEFFNSDTTVSFGNVPSLAEVSFGCGYSFYFMHNINQLSCFLYQLHTLKLDLFAIPVPEAVPYNIPQLYNLKHLEMTIKVEDDDCFLPCAAFLKASPSLYKFILKIFLIKPSSGSVRTVKDHPYVSISDLSIRVVELIGFQGLKGTADVEFLICLIENAKLLEKIVVDPCKSYYLGTPQELWYRESEDCQSARKRAIELAAKFPQWEFVIP